MNYNYLKINVCPVCKSTNVKELYHNITDKLDINNSFSVLSCKDCTHAFTSPVPDSNYLIDYYSDKYYSYNIDISANNKKLKFKIKRWLYKSSNNNLIYRLIAKPIIRQTAIFPKYKSNGKLLDIGCGNGAFLSFMKEIGWNTFGIEISQKAVDIASLNGHNIFTGNLLDAKYPDNYFDVITLNNVLEHLSNPTTEIEEINRILKPKGELIICVPNFSSFSSRIFKNNWLGLIVPEHLQHFTHKSLELSLNNNGFNNISTKGIYRKILLSNIRSYPKNNKFLLFNVYTKVLALSLLTLFIFPFLFIKAGINFCMFITTTAYKN